ncbi:MAG: hypothetical protein KAI66_02350 [Lentisphaeria bacterium]|nr:hypothetical protein [Lentisphaeria bacterium]
MEPAPPQPDATVRILHGDVVIFGTINYAGRQPGDILVQLFAEDKARGIFDGAPLETLRLASPGSFVFAPVPGEDRRYAVRAFLDADGGNAPDADEAAATSPANLIDPVGGPARIQADVTLLDLDTDTDALPDWWENHYFTSLDQRAWDDPDEDGIANLAEYRNGTDPDQADEQPDKPASTLSIAILNGALHVDGRAFVPRGILYEPVAPGDAVGNAATAYTHDHLERDLPRLQELGVNVIRTTIRPADTAVLDICQEFGIKVMLGYPIDPVADLADDAVREAIRADFATFVGTFKNHPALLMWCIGDGVNGELSTAAAKATWYRLLNELAWFAQDLEGTAWHPVTTANAGLADLAIYAPLTRGVDLWGLNSAGRDTFATTPRRSAPSDLFADYAALNLGCPMWVSRYGIDAWQATPGYVNEARQARVAEQLAQTMAAESAQPGLYQDARDAMVSVGSQQDVIDGAVGLADLAWQDLNTNGRWDEQEDVWYEPFESRSGIFDADLETPIVGTALPSAVGSQTDIAFHDVNGNGIRDPEEDIWQDAPVAGARERIFDEGIDVILVEGTRGIAIHATDGTLGVTGALFYHDADENGVYTDGELLWQDTDRDQPGIYNAAGDVLVYVGDEQDVLDGDVGLTEGLYFADANEDGVWDAQEDVWSKRPGRTIGGVYDAFSDQWAAAGAADTHDPGDNESRADPDLEYFGVMRYALQDATQLRPRLAYHALRQLWNGETSAPVVLDLEIETPEDTPITFALPVLHLEGFSLQLDNAPAGQHGGITGWDQRDGFESVTYTPEPDFTGADRIPYTATNRSGRAVIQGTIIVRVTSLDEAPRELATDPDTAIIPIAENQILSLVISAHEADGQDVIFTYVLPEGQALEDITFSDAAYDAAEDLWSATLTWTPDYDESSLAQDREIAITFTATDTTGHSADLARTIRVVNVNRQPTSSETSITPGTPFASEAITVSWTYSDPDGDAEVADDVQIRWYRAARGRNVDTLLPTFSDLATIPAGSLTPGDQIYCRVWPSDGDLPVAAADDATPDGTAAESAHITILNSVASVAILPASAYTQDDLSFSVTWASTTAGQPSYDIQWLKNSVAAGTGQTIASAGTARGQQWVATITAWVEAGRERHEAPAVNSTTITIQDTPPPAPSAAEFSVDPPTMEDDIELINIVQATDADGDAITHEIQWSRQDDFAETIAGNPLTSDQTASDEVWWARVRSAAPAGAGGTARSDWLVVGSVQIAYRFELHLYPGWNLVSLPIVPIDDPDTAEVDESTATGLFGDRKTGPAWYWQNDGVNPPNYVTVDPQEQEGFTGTLQALRGFWVYHTPAVNDPTPTVVIVPGRPLDSEATPNPCILILQADWNLCGPCVDFTETPPTVPGLGDTVWSWRAEARRYAPLDYINPEPNQRVRFLRGQGYWLYIRPDAAPANIDVGP